MSRNHQSDPVILELTGSEAEHGLSLANFAAFIEDFRRALRGFDRQQRAAPASRGGHPTSREELVTAFRLVRFKPGSAIVELEPIAPPVPDEDQPSLADSDSELLPLANLRAFMETLDRDDPLDPAVTTAVAGARQALGQDGKISITIPNGDRQHSRLVIDKRRIESLERRARRHAPRRMRITGRLHMIDLEPDRVAIRAADGIDWVCGYPADLEAKVKALVDTNVWAQGFGQLTGASRGKLTIDRIEQVDEFEETPLFTFERLPLSELMEQQGILRPQGADFGLAPSVSDAELDAFMSALQDE